MKAIALSALLASAASVVIAFDITFPNSDAGYWVANHTNTLNWKANSTDPAYFSVQLLNKNSSMLNGNFQIGNALLTKNGSAQIFIDKIPTGTYSILFVNSSNYQLDHPQVYQSSDSFEVKAVGTAPAAVTANTDSDPNSTATTAEMGAPAATLSSTSGTNTNKPDAKKNSAGITSANIGAAASISIVALLFGLGVVV